MSVTASAVLKLPRRPRAERADFAGLSVCKYADELKPYWDAFVAGAANATFLFQRDYMDYHRERFTDHSLMIFQGSQVVAVLPANLRSDRVLVSHEGLTYGGLVIAPNAGLLLVLSSLYAVMRYLVEEGITSLVYKRIPAFYTVRPDDDIAYGLFLVEASLFRRDCAQVVPMPPALPFQKRRRRQINKARSVGLRLVQEQRFSPFWEQVLEPRLAARYGTKPVHSVREISHLANHFPQHIKQFSVYRDLEILAGITIYETATVAHSQYIAGSDVGREAGALDYLLDWLIHDRYQGKEFFDFGICNESEGRTLNHGLLEWKESFGARTYTHEFYRISTLAFPRLESALNVSHAAPQPTNAGTNGG